MNKVQLPDPFVRLLGNHLHYRDRERMRRVCRRWNMIYKSLKPDMDYLSAYIVDTTVSFVREITMTCYGTHECYRFIDVCSSSADDGSVKSEKLHDFLSFSRAIRSVKNVDFVLSRNFNIRQLCEVLRLARSLSWRTISVTIRATYSLDRHSLHLLLSTVSSSVRQLKIIRPQTERDVRKDEEKLDDSQCFLKTIMNLPNLKELQIPLYFIAGPRVENGYRLKNLTNLSIETPSTGSSTESIADNITALTNSKSIVTILVKADTASETFQQYLRRIENLYHLADRPLPKQIVFDVGSGSNTEMEPNRSFE